MHSEPINYVNHLCSDKGLTLKTSANLIFTVFNISTSTLHIDTVHSNYVKPLTAMFLCPN